LRNASASRQEGAGVNESELVVDKAFADREVFYSKSDEKFTVRALLDELFGETQFERAMDVGPGEGHITEPLARRSKNLLLVEETAQYETILRQQFPHARVLIADYKTAPLSGPFDLIMLSHVLYYQPTDQWVPACKRLVDLLSDKGELLIMLNSDAGDWWKIMHHYSPALADHISFHYKPVTQFKRELGEVARVQSLSYRYQVWIEPGATWADFIGRQILELDDEAILRQYADDFAQFARQFKTVDNSVVMDFRSDLLRLRKLT
jgi:trans-aconitate methyltransferase